MTVQNSNTSPITAHALERHSIIALIVQSLLNPLPHGNDGENVGDVDLEEKAVRLVHTYLTCCGGSLDPGQKTALADWLRKRTSQGERWDLGSEEVDELLRKLGQ